MRFWIIPVIALSAILLIYAATSLKQTVSNKTATSYRMEEPFDKVRKNLVRTNSMDEFVEAQHGQLLDIKYEKLEMNIARLFGQKWEIRGRTVATVKQENEWIGDQILIIQQKLYISPDKLLVESKLRKPTPFIKEYTQYTTVEREGNGTRVRENIDMTISVIAPKPFVSKQFIKDEMDKASIQGMARAERVMREVASRRPPIFVLKPRR